MISATAAVRTSLPAICRSSLYNYTPAPELQTARLHFHPIFNILSKIRTLGLDSRLYRFIFIKLRTLGEKTSSRIAALAVFRFPTYSTQSLYFHFRHVGISPMFSTRCGLFATFCNRLSFFPSTYSLFFAKQGVGYTQRHKFFSSQKRRSPKREKAPNRLGGGDPELGG
jgi:hypothetical protein